jgi:peptide/nickel transport system permease protein
MVAEVDATVSYPSKLHIRSARALELTRQLLRNKVTLFGVVVIILLLGMAVFAPFIIAPNMPDPYQLPRDWMMIDAPPGTPGFPLGTTPEGGDVFYGIVWGARLSVRLSLLVVGIAVGIGVMIGSIAAMLGRRVDEFLMRVVDIFMSVPELIFPLAIAALLGPSFTNIIISLCAVLWAKYARIVRGQILLIREMPYVEAASVIGDSRLNIYFRDVLPNCITPIIVQATLDVGKVVLLGATLSFIGLSEAGLAEWGVLVSKGQSGIATGQWWTSVFPGAMIFLWALAFNLVGDGLRDVLDPRLDTSGKHKN